MNRNQLWNCTHFRYSTDEQLRYIDISRNNNLLSVSFKLLSRSTLRSATNLMFFSILLVFATNFIALSARFVGIFLVSHWCSTEEIKLKHFQDFMRLEWGLAHPILTLLIGSFWPRHVVSRIMVDYLPSLYSIIQSNSLSETVITSVIFYSLLQR